MFEESLWFFSHYCIGSLWGETCCSVIDGKLQLKHASAAKKRTWWYGHRRASVKPYMLWWGLGYRQVLIILVVGLNLMVRTTKLVVWILEWGKWFLTLCCSVKIVYIEPEECNQICYFSHCPCILLIASYPTKPHSQAMWELFFLFSCGLRIRLITNRVY